MIQRRKLPSSILLMTLMVIGYMKSFFYLMMMSLLLLTSACDNGDETEFVLSAQKLEQTTWKATRTVSDSSGKEYISHYMLQFLTNANGTYADLDEGREYPDMTFSYSIDRRIFTFKRLFPGDYTIMSANQEKLVLQAYLPEKCVIVLERQY